MQKPEKTFRIGAVSASVFVNKTEDGREFRSVSLQRSFKQGDEWKTATNFALSELPAAVAVLQMATSHVAELDRTNAMAENAATTGE
ncbi:MAG: hypothetical protein DWQ34_10090 [Planctomycetota bacterium]|nr:MAG: hypothetical protein DWQ34_10090 [Planctomycetota bacterium]REK27039.1 MAG: hypothetical protein DWQ41_08580 [Planctomycetota bacterium]REK34705.1 MAG: hypothetical protein DWQ45_12860 [Planctomycetota bacterium]